MPSAGQPLAAAFQSTSSVRRTTGTAQSVGAVLGISIHVLRAEDDSECKSHTLSLKIFQSTSSVRRTTAPGCVDLDAETISIHVLRAEDDGKNREKSLFALI